jgi:hypothetical protein
MTAKRDAQVGVTAVAVSPAVDTYQRLRLKTPGGFFQALPDDGLHQAFLIFQVAGWLVETYRPSDVFFDHQKAVMSFSDDSDGDPWFPDHNCSIVSGM